VAIPPRLVITVSLVLCHHIHRRKGRLYAKAFSQPPLHWNEALSVAGLPRSGNPIRFGCP